MCVDIYWLFPYSFMFGISFTETGVELFLGILALSFSKASE